MPRPLKILTETRACTLCADHLPNPPRPLLQASSQSRILIVGQAPGQKAHDAATPWLDASGKRLREWLQLSDEQFYDPALVALVPMGFCYPGTGPRNSGDLPPRPECAPTWHPPILKAMPNIKLTILLGRYALDRYLPENVGPYKTITAAVKDHISLLKHNLIALPHPSPRNNIWLKKNLWFGEQVLKSLRRQIASVLEA